jgi:TPR repeat protein
MTKPYLFTTIAIAALLVASTTGAQTPAPPAKPGDDTQITIFARKKAAPHTIESAETEMAATDPHFGCALMLKNQPSDGYKHPKFGGAGLNGPTLPPKRDVSGNPADVTASPGSGAIEAAAAENCRVIEDRRMEILAYDKDMPAAYAAYAAGDYKTALPLFIKAYNKLAIVTSPRNLAERGGARTLRGIPALAVMVGRMYLYGQGTPPDTAKAIEWFKKAANEPTAPDESGLVNAMSSPAEAAMYLARIYETGADVPVDPKEARRWYERAADLDYYPAVHLCGLIYRKGYGGEQNMSKAMAFFLRAGMAGYAPSQYTLGQIYYSGEDGVPQDKMRAGAWLLKAAQGGYPDALYAVGRMYDLGEGGAAVDPAKALVYYKEAAVKGQPDAENAVGLSFYTGNGLSKDLLTARKWFLKASEDANPDAMFNLAVMLINGEGGDKDLVKAWVWLKIADAGGHPSAKAALAELEAKMTPEEKAKAQALFQPAPAP